MAQIVAFVDPDAVPEANQRIRQLTIIAHDHRVIVGEGESGRMVRAIISVPADGSSSGRAASVSTAWTTVGLRRRRYRVQRLWRRWRRAATSTRPTKLPSRFPFVEVAASTSGGGKFERIDGE